MINIVMRNKKNQVVRSYLFKSGSEAHLVSYEHSQRLDLVASLDSLLSKKVKFKLVNSFKASDLMNKSIDASPFLRISASKAQEEVFLDGNLATDDSDKKIITTLKFSALTHVVSLVLVLSIGYVVQRFFKENPKKFEVVLLDPSTSKSFQDLKLPAATVKMIENKRPQKAIVRAPIKPTTVRPRQRMLAQPSSKRVAPQAEIGAMKALDQLGGLGSVASSKTKGSGSSVSGQGAFGSKIGLGGGLGSSTGGIKNGLSGKGLVSGLSGEGSKSIGANGMGSTKYAGGNRGFGGKASSAGLGSLIVPDFDDSEIVGGLTREQVNSVVKKKRRSIAFLLRESPPIAAKFTGSHDQQVGDRPLRQSSVL